MSHKAILGSEVLKNHPEKQEGVVGSRCVCLLMTFELLPKASPVLNNSCRPACQYTVCMGCCCQRSECILHSTLDKCHGSGPLNLTGQHGWFVKLTLGAYQHDLKIHEHYFLNLARDVSASPRVPTAQENKENGQKKISVREYTGNLEILPKHREFCLLNL